MMAVFRKSCLILTAALASGLGTSALAAISFDAEGGSDWWFDPVNWSLAAPATVLTPGVSSPLPPSGAVTAPTFTDAQINGPAGGPGYNVVYDPAHDPFFINPDVVDNNAVDGADFLQLQRQGVAPTNWSRQYGGTGYGAADYVYPAGTVDIGGGAPLRNYGPETLYRLYISRNTTNANTLTIKSGDLAVGSTIIIGRSGSTLTTQNLGQVVQTGGIFRVPANTLDIGQSEASGWGNGTYDYRGGTLEVQQFGGTQGIRLSAGSATTGAGGVGKLIMHNPGTPGRVHTFDFTLASIANDANGTTRGVGIAEFHVENGGTRPVQIDRNLSINNGADQTITTATRSSRLALVLDQAPALTAGVPQNLGLFDVDFGGTFGGLILGTGDLNGDTIYDNDRVFSNAAGTAAYREGDTVSAIFGGTQYNWTISYTGDIQWTDAAASVVGTIAGPGSGKDVVLIGLSSNPAPSIGAVPEPSTVALGLLAALGLSQVRRRKAA